MTKVKLILTAVAVFVTVGGALAFKVKQAPNLLWCATVNGVPNICTQSPYSDVSGFLTNYPIRLLFKQGTIGQPCTATNCTINPTQRFINQ